MISAITNIAAYGRDPIGFLVDKREKYGNIFQFRLGPLPVTFFASPSDIECIYSNPKAFQRSKMMGMIRPITGPSILISTGAVWKKKRLAAQPVFQPAAIGSLLPLMQRLTEKRLDLWAKRGGEAIDMQEGAIELTLEIVTEALFGKGVEHLPPTFHQSLDTLFQILAGWVENPLSLPTWVPTSRNRRFKEAKRELDSLIYGLIDSFIERGGEGTALLAVLLRSLRNEDGTYDRQAARDEMVTYFLAGFETTATTLSWILYELARKPDAAERIRQEVPKRIDSTEGFAKLKWPSRVIREVLRLHPPAWILDFEVMEDSEIGTRKMRKGQHVWISQYVTQRLPELWTHPNEFEPDRFRDEEDRTRHKYAFFPFGAGSRHCIGQGFAMLELQVAVTELCRRFRWKLADDKPVPHLAGFVLRSGAPIRCRFEEITPNLK